MLTFLNLTFKVVYKTYTVRNALTATNTAASKAKVMDFLKVFDHGFDQQVHDFAILINFVKEMPEYQPIATALPYVTIDILQKINNEVKSM